MLIQGTPGPASPLSTLPISLVEVMDTERIWWSTPDSRCAQEKPSDGSIISPAPAATDRVAPRAGVWSPVLAAVLRISEQVQICPRLRVAPSRCRSPHPSRPSSRWRAYAPWSPRRRSSKAQRKAGGRLGGEVMGKATARVVPTLPPTAATIRLEPGTLLAQELLDARGFHAGNFPGGVEHVLQRRAHAATASVMRYRRWPAPGAPAGPVIFSRR